jgi:hypothetical protein
MEETPRSSSSSCIVLETERHASSSTAASGLSLLLGGCEVGPARAVAEARYAPKFGGGRVRYQPPWQFSGQRCSRFCTPNVLPGGIEAPSADSLSETELGD